jgi:hypothetical protein
VAEKGTERRGSRHRWVFEILDRAGAIPEDSEEGFYTYRLTDGLVDLLKRDRVTFTFRKRLAGNGVELVSPGSWLHDQLLAYARGRGRITRGFLAPRPDLDREQLAAARRRGFQGLSERLERRYGLVLVFTFRLAYYSDPPRETLETVAYDCERRRVMRRAVSRKTVCEASESPEETFGAAPKPDLDAAFGAAWEEIQDRVESRVHALQHEGREFLENELATVERYYRQLIAEEKRLQKSRSSKRGHEESRRKIDLLKLEWERRVKEETERLRPQVVVSLSALARLHVPLERWRAAVNGKNGLEDKELWLDLARSEAWEGSGSGSRGR